MDRVDDEVLRKLVVALLACLTLFLSQRTLTTTNSRARSVPQVSSAPDEAAKSTRTAAL